MGKEFRSRNKTQEEEDSKLYDSVKEDISIIRKNLKIINLDDGNEELIYESLQKIDRIKGSLFSYIFDGKSAKAVLEDRALGFPWDR